MSDVVISAEGLGKKYLIGHEANRERYSALRDVTMRMAKGFVKSAMDMLRGRELVHGDEVEEFWALKDVSFEIKRGEVVGIIGRNGAGKSTLLKILSRITEPSTGRVEIKGRVASLLEVGTGFHPELTGRENIFLNGAILGMTRAEIRRKFDEIVAFAEVEKFLDTPVKRYSSGMYVRLAFAVAAHLEPEILVVDEVLAVGDAEFQKKCLGKMQDVAGHGRTVLFVSHNMGPIKNLCSTAILLKQGKVLLTGGTIPVIGAYFDSRSHATSTALNVLCNEITNGSVALNHGDDISAHIDLTINSSIAFAVEAQLLDRSGSQVAYAEIGATHEGKKIPCVEGEHSFEFTIPSSNLANGVYYLTIEITVPFERYLARTKEQLTVEINNGAPGATRIFTQDWGIASVRLPSNIKVLQHA